MANTFHRRTGSVKAPTIPSQHDETFHRIELHPTSVYHGSPRQYNRLTDAETFEISQEKQSSPDRCDEASGPSSRPKRVPFLVLLPALCVVVFSAGSATLLLVWLFIHPLKGVVEESNKSLFTGYVLVDEGSKLIQGRLQSALNGLIVTSVTASIIQLTTAPVATVLAYRIAGEWLKGQSSRDPKCVSSDQYGMLMRVIGSADFMALWESARYLLKGPRKRPAARLLLKSFVFVCILFIISNLILVVDLWLHAASHSITVPVTLSLDAGNTTGTSTPIQRPDFNDTLILTTAFQQTRPGEALREALRPLFSDLSPQDFDKRYSQEVSRLVFSYASTLNDDVPAQTTDENVIKIVSRYPRPPLALFVALLYLHSAIVLFIAVWAGFSSSASVTLPTNKDGSRPRSVGEVQLLREYLISPQALVDHHFHSSPSGLSRRGSGGSDEGTIVVDLDSNRADSGGEVHRLWVGTRPRMDGVEPRFGIWRE